jgi:hypothetical protein
VGGTCLRDWLIAWFHDLGSIYYCFVRGVPLTPLVGAMISWNGQPHNAFSHAIPMLHPTYSVISMNWQGARVSDVQYKVKLVLVSATCNVCTGTSYRRVICKGTKQRKILSVLELALAHAMACY